MTREIRLNIQCPLCGTNNVYVQEQVRRTARLYWNGSAMTEGYANMHKESRLIRCGACKWIVNGTDSIEKFEAELAAQYTTGVPE